MAVSEELRLKAKAMLEEGYSLNAIAEELGVSSSTIGAIRDRYGMTCRKANREKNPECLRMSNICWDCAKYYGDCPWTEYDEEKEEVIFGEVEGWTLERYEMNGEKHARIAACPLFEEG